MALIIDPDQLSDSAADDNSTEVYIDTTGKTIKLVVTGNLSTDGVTLKALYSFLKEEWRNDPNTKNLAAFPFPMVPITDESFEFVDGWDLLNDTARNLIRTAGWTVRNSSGNVIAKYAGIIGLGTIEANDQLYYNQGAGATNVVLQGQVNQAVKILHDPNGDGNFTDGFDRRTVFSLFAREYQQVYGKSSLTDIGVSSMDAIAYRFPISTAGDLKIQDTDVNVAANSPYTEIVVRYFDGAYTRDVDGVAPRNFGIVIDVGTHSGIDGSCSNGGNSLTSLDGGIPTDGTYDGGTLTIHEGAAAGVYTIGTIVSATAVPITTTFPGATSGASFTLQRATPVSATAEQIYTKIQYLLRQDADIDETGGSIIGKTADELLNFVGDTLVCGSKTPNNSNGGGSGVIIEGFLSADTNRIEFYDNTATKRTFPYVAVLTINFGDNLRLDGSAKYWVYFTTLPGAGNDFGESGAVIVEDNFGVDMAGNVGGATSIQKTFNYDGNTQGGRTAGTDAGITVVGIGLSTGQYVKATGTIARSTANSISLVAALERNYANA
jgi:hypothetical protein